MLDFRHETFLILCNTKNYTKAAEVLYITQPAVTQHIKFLEKYYGVKLFNYEKKVLTLTKAGEKLYDFVVTINADSKKIKEIFTLKSLQSFPLSFGTTLTIGEYIMPEILNKLIKEYPELHVTMLVDNTQVLLQKLQEGKIDFIILEGFFDKFKYDSVLFSSEKFIPVCSGKSDLKNRDIKFSEILDYRLIVREKGSGTRNIFEQALYKHNLSLESFDKVCEIGNINIIKELVKEDLGLTFLYKAAVEKELKNGDLNELSIADFSAEYEFNFVFLKGSQHKKEYLKWYEFLKAVRN